MRQTFIIMTDVSFELSLICSKLKREEKTHQSVTWIDFRRVTETKWVGHILQQRKLLPNFSLNINCS